jgi:mRNA interferase HigB
MNVISKKRLLGYIKKHSDAKSQLLAWFGEAKRAQWNNPQHIKSRYPSASFLPKNDVVFNVKGNKYRLVVNIRYESQIVFIKWFGTHSEYDKLDL